MQTGPNLLAVWMQPPPDFEDEFHGWYENEHMAERMALPGFLGVRRYVNLDTEPKFLALYELATGDALYSDEYKEARKNSTPLTRKVGQTVTTLLRCEYEQIKSIGPNPIEPAPYLLVVKMETDAEHDEELNRWYNEEHLAALAGVPGCLGARRYRATLGEPKYMAVYELTSPDVRTSAEWRAAADTPWTQKMRPHFHRMTGEMGQLIGTVE